MLSVPKVFDGDFFLFTGAFEVLRYEEAHFVNIACDEELAA